ncbi:MAG: DinB family protein [Blastocatellia bacterium]|nr:DinB family protein [Blastocatellia bacterium]MBK6425321.1 DinB family protein [Blastocatellia bacterium]
MSTVSSAQLQQFLGELEDSSRRLSTLVASLSPEQATARPEGAAWGVADNLAHLSLTTEAFLPLLDAASTEGREHGMTGFGPFGMGFLARALLWFVDPSSNVPVKVKTQKAFEPVGTGSVNDELGRFLELQERLAKAVVAFDGLAIDKLKVASPFEARLKYPVVGAIAIIAAHQRRHILQAERAAAAVV